jgi:hypothetical protein
MSTTTQVWNTYEKIVSETMNESKITLEEEDGQDYGEVLKELRRAWELKLIQSGALALGTEVDPNLQKATSGSKLGVKLEDGAVPVKKEEGAEEQPPPPQAEEEEGQAALETAAAAAATTTTTKTTEKKKEEGEGEEQDQEERPAKRRKPTPASPPAAATATEGNQIEAKKDTTATDTTAGAADPLAGIDIDDDLDDDLDDLLGEQEDPEDLVLAKVDKKFKSKNKYRFHFRSGILKINGREFVFEKGKGDFKW